MYDNIQRQDMADILYGSYIKYDRMYEMTKFALYGANDVDHINIYIDCYSILRSLYTRGGEVNRKDSYAIASCLINLAIHIRAYFETRHNIMSKVYLIYGRARPRQAIINYYNYNQKNMFMEDRVLFYGEVLSYVINIREMETAFGVLPIPKYDEMQEEYYTYCNAIASTATVPKTGASEELGMITSVLEGMAIQSYIQVTPAYYDIALSRKYTRDDESAEMLDIALANRVYDIGRIYSLGGIGSIFQTLASSGSTDFASSLAKSEKAAKKMLDRIVKDYTELE